MKSLRVLGAEPAPSLREEEPPRAPLFRAMSAPIDFGEGFYREELAEGLPFRWMSLSGGIQFEPHDAERFLELSVRSHFYDLSQRLTVGAEDANLGEYDLVRGWNAISVQVPAGAGAVRLQVNKVFPPAYYPGDGRALAVQVRSVVLHGDPVRHGHIARQHENAARNVRETFEGAVVLSSTPPKLGIDIQGACNVKPPCVYCAWDFNKAIEGDNVDVPFTTETLAEWGAFFDNSAELVNCSIGEPFMGRNLDDVLDAMGDQGKVLEMTTNGQILTDGNIRRLLGRNIHLYVSLDAATAETYAKLRNPRFDQVLENVRRLVAAKGGPGHLPLVYAVFMPMKANAHEVDAFVRLCTELKVDRLVLRPLNDSEGVELRWDRSGYHFDYQKEILTWPELVRISGHVAELCRRLGVDLSDQLDFGGSMEQQFAEAYAAGRREALALLGAEAQTPASPPTPAVPPVRATPEPLPSLGDDKLPACTEPWSSLYVLRRGVMPCCYGGQPIGKMNQYREAWNSPLMQGIRRELLRGTFHRYCFESPDCPIVKKSHEAHRLSVAEEATLKFQRIHDRWKRVGYGRPGRIYRQLKAYGITGTRRLKRLLGIDTQ